MTRAPAPRAFPGSLQVRAPAKLNLHLAVLAREASGYHQLETVFCELDLTDRLEVRRGQPGLRLEVDGTSLGRPEENLVHRAARAFYRTAAIAPAAEIRLEKRIPVGAGLGGGSSDAAATLRALNVLHHTPLDDAALLHIGAALGSDVPFFLIDSPLALGWGRGQRLLALPPLPPAPVLLVVPDFALSTAQTYGALDQDRAEGDDRVAPHTLTPEAFATWDAIASYACNDFEPVVFRRHPELARLREGLAASGARLTHLTGTGSALFAIYTDTPALARGAERLHRQHDGVTVIETATAGARLNPTAHGGS